MRSEFIWGNKLSRLGSIKIISYLWLGSIMGAGCAFLTQVILARELSPAAFGVFAAVLGIVTLAAPLASFGLGGFWLKAFGQEGWQAVRWLRSSLKYALLTTIFVLIGLLTWAVFGPHDGTTRCLLIVLSSYLLGQVAIELVSAKLQLEERYLALAIWQFMPHLLRLLLVIILAFVMAKVMTLWGVAFVYASIAIGIFCYGTVLLWLMYHGRLNLKGHAEQELSVSEQTLSPRISQVASESWPFGLAGVFYLIYFQSDVILLKYLAGDEAAGVYNVAFVVMAAVYMLPVVVYQKFLMPKIHRWASHDREKFYQVYCAGNWVMLVFGIFAMLGIWLLAPWGISFFFSESYSEAVLPLNILAFAAPVRFLATSVGSTLVTQEHMKRKVWLMAFTALFNVVLNIVFIPRYGIVGAAVTTVVSDIALLVMYIYFAKYHVFVKGAA